ncbi:Nucleoporin nup93 [Balamuthia mandrillaris]
MSRHTDFSALLEQSRQLTSHLDTQDYLIHRNVEQINETSRRLLAKVSGADKSATKNMGQSLLAEKRFDAEKLARSLNAINLKTTFGPLEPLSETDVEGYLKHEHNMIILTAIQEAKNETITRFKENYVRNMERDWENSKPDLLEALGKHSASRAGERPRMASPTSTAGAYMGGAARPVGWGEVPALVGVGGKKGKMDAKMLAYARVIHLFHEHRIAGKPYDLLLGFTEAALSVDETDARREEVADCWKLLQRALQRDSTQFSATFISGAKSFLEEQYRHIATLFIRRNARQAALGGEPGIQNFVRAFWRAQFGSDPHNWPKELEEVVDGYPIWPQVYFALRCGDLQGALEIALSAARVLGDFPSLLQEYIEYQRVLDPAHLNECRRVVRASSDVYKRAVYTIIGRCKPQKSLPSVFSTTQDWLWLQLSLIDETEPQGEPQGGSRRGRTGQECTLRQLQELVRSYGEAHFSSRGRDPLLYFQVLLMTQQFERAIQYLRKEQFHVEAVHFAIALHHFGVLNQVPAADETFFVEDQGGRCLINFVRLLRQYVRSFCLTDPVIALEYYLLISDEAIRHRCIKDLVLETREFEVLLGAPLSQQNTLRLKQKEGYIQKFIQDEKKVSQILELAARDSEANGNHEDAINLYHLSQNYDKVLSIINSLLSQVLTSQSAERQRLSRLAESIYKVYDSQQLQAKIHDHLLWNTFGLLLSLLDFFDYLNAGHREQALEILMSMDIIPFDMSEMTDKVERFRYIDEAIRRNFADILLAAMTILYKTYTAMKKSAVSTGFAQPLDGGREQEMQSLRDKARALVTFAGRIQYRMPGDTNSRLIRYEAFMS